MTSIPCATSDSANADSSSGIGLFLVALPLRGAYLHDSDGEISPGFWASSCRYLPRIRARRGGGSASGIGVAMSSMLFDTDDSLRGVFTDLHARSILACGGLKESIQDLKRDVMRMVYEVKDRREVTDEVLADLLGISDRWLRMLGDTKPAPDPVSDGRRILLILQVQRDWTAMPELMDSLREAGELTSPRRVQRLLAGLIELGQVQVRGKGRERRYCAKSPVSVHVARKRERSREARKRLSSLLSVVHAYVHDAPGAVCSRYQYRVKAERVPIVAERLRNAISQILQEEERACEGAPVQDSVEYTVLLNAAMGLSGIEASPVPPNEIMLQ